jgi:uncharacterized protein YraI
MILRYFVVGCVLLVIGVVSPVPTMAQACSGFDTQLRVGIEAQVAPGTPNSLRAQPSTSSERIGSIPAGGRFAIIGGPRCGNGFTFWQVNYNNIIGWTAEGTDDDYYLVPYEALDDIEETVVNIRPNNILSGLGVSGGGGGSAAYKEIALTDNNLAFIGIDGIDLLQSGTRVVAPIRANVLYNDLHSHPYIAIHACITPSDTTCLRDKPDVRAISPTGVVYAGDEYFGSRFYTLAPPFTCNGSLPSQLRSIVNGARVADGVRVADGIGVLNLRPSPDNDPVLERIPAGAVAEIIGGPECGSGSNVWWNVRYNGITGWVAENSATQQWIEPVEDFRGYWLPPEAYLQSGVWQLQYGAYVIEIVIPDINAPYGILARDGTVYAIGGFAPFENLLAMNTEITATFNADANGQALITNPPLDGYIVIVGETGNYVHDSRRNFVNAATGDFIEAEDIVNSILVQMNR